MRDDAPTLPNLGGYEPGTVTDPGAFGETPTWPPASERPRSAFGPHRSPKGCVNASLLRVSLGANAVLLMGLLGLLLLRQASVLGLGGPPDPSAPGAALSNATALPSPTGTNSPAATSNATQLSGVLQVTPSSVHLTCDGDQRTQVVVLVNTGSEEVQWQAIVDGAADRAGIAITPNRGDLDAGATVQIQLQNTTRSGSEGHSSRQGVIRLAPASVDAGSPASLRYTSDRCR